MKIGWKLKLSKRLIYQFGFLVLFLGSITSVIGQASLPEKVSDDFYIFPIKPGVRNTLAGTMGELRSSHFHTGIDTAEAAI